MLTSYSIMIQVKLPILSGLCLHKWVCNLKNRRLVSRNISEFDALDQQQLQAFCYMPVFCGDCQPCHILTHNYRLPALADNWQFLKQQYFKTNKRGINLFIQNQIFGTFKAILIHLQLSYMYLKIFFFFCVKKKIHSGDIFFFYSL